MEKLSPMGRQAEFKRLKLTKKRQLTKNTFSLEFEIPEDLKSNYRFEAGQYITVKYPAKGELFQNDFSMTSAPHEEKISLGIKINNEESSTKELFEDFEIGDEVEISEPKGRSLVLPAELGLLL